MVYIYDILIDIRNRWAISRLSSVLLTLLHSIFEPKTVVFKYTIKPHYFFCKINIEYALHGSVIPQLHLRLV